jgi:hypothetical protein
MVAMPAMQDLVVMEVDYSSCVNFWNFLTFSVTSVYFR